MSLKSKITKATSTVVLKKINKVSYEDYLINSLIVDLDLCLVYFRVPNEPCCFYYDELLPRLAHYNSGCTIITLNLNETTLHYEYGIKYCPSVVVLSKAHKPKVIKKQLSLTDLVDAIENITKIRLNKDVVE